MSYALILFDVIHGFLCDDDPVLAVPLERWTPPPQAMVAITDAAARHLRHNTPWNEKGFDWAFVLDAQRREIRERFAPAFAELDAKRARPAAEVAEAMALGETPKTADLDILGQLNMVAEANREMLAELDALVILEGADEAAVLTLLDTAENIRPWLPWATGATGIGTMREGAVGANVTRPEAVGVETVGPEAVNTEAVNTEAVNTETVGAETSTQGKVTS